MAYAIVNQKIQRAPRGKRYVHRRVVLTPVGSAGSAVATAQVVLPCAGRLIAAECDFTSIGATADILVKADTTAGVTILTMTDTSADFGLKPVGTVAKDETNAATAATDAFSGGFPVRKGVFVDVAQADPTADALKLDLYFRLCTFAQVTLTASSGADGTGAASRFLDLNGSGSLAAVALDFTSQPAATVDTSIKADSATGTVLFATTNTATDLAPSLIGRPGMNALFTTGAPTATAATDGTEGANCFKRGLQIEFAQGDIFTTGDETIVFELWIDE